MPGIAGIVLTLAVAVDANVLINERIKEELKNGRSVQQAIHEGYKGAFSSIVDANITTLITAVILYAVGTGSIKGFCDHHRYRWRRPCSPRLSVPVPSSTCFTAANALTSCLSEECVVAQDYTVEQLNYGRKVYDFMRWDYLAFGISLLLLVASIATMSVRGFNWGLDFTGGTVIEINLEKPANLDLMRDTLEKAGFQDPIIQNFGSSRDVMVRMPPATGTAGQELGNKVIGVINDSVDKNATVKRIEFVGPSVGSELAQTGGMALLVALICILIYVGFRFEWRLALGRLSRWRTT